MFAHGTARYYVWRVWCVSSKSFAWTVAIVSQRSVFAVYLQTLTGVCGLSPPVHASVRAIFAGIDQ